MHRRGIGVLDYPVLDLTRGLGSGDVERRRRQGSQIEHILKRWTMVK